MEIEDVVKFENNEYYVLDKMTYENMELFCLVLLKNDEPTETIRLVEYKNNNLYEPSKDIMGKIMPLFVQNILESANNN